MKIASIGQEILGARLQPGDVVQAHYVVKVRAHSSTAILRCHRTFWPNDESHRSEARVLRSG
jgi:hypothetical protein